MISASVGKPVVLQDAEATGNGQVISIPVGCKNHSFYIKANGAVMTGAIQLESSSGGDYAGTWAPIGGGPIALVSNAELIYSVTGAFLFVRARISTSVTGTTVTVTYVGT